MVNRIVILCVNGDNNRLLGIGCLHPTFVSQPLANDRLYLGVRHRASFPLQTPKTFFFTLGNKRGVLRIMTIPRHKNARANRTFLSLPNRPRTSATTSGHLSLVPNPLRRVRGFIRVDKTFHRHDVGDGTRSILVKGQPFPIFLPLPVIPVLTLTPKLQILRSKRPIFGTRPIERPPGNRTKTPGVSRFPNTIGNNKIMVGIAVSILLVNIHNGSGDIPPLYPTRDRLVTSAIHLLQNSLTQVRKLSCLVTRRVVFFLLFPTHRDNVTNLYRGRLIHRNNQVAFVDKSVLSTFYFLQILTVIRAVPSDLDGHFTFTHVTLWRDYNDRGSFLLSVEGKQPVRATPASNRCNPELLGLPRANARQVYLHPTPGRKDPPPLTIRATGRKERRARVRSHL